MNDIVCVRKIGSLEEALLIDRRSSELPTKIGEAGIKFWLLEINMNIDPVYEIVRFITPKRSINKLCEIVKQHKRQFLFSGDPERYNDLLEDVHKSISDYKEDVNRRSIFGRILEFVRAIIEIIAKRINIYRIVLTE